MHHLIFRANANDATGPAKLAEYGLADCVAGAEFMVTDTGPENQAGVLCAWRKPGDGCDLCYAPERQTWVPAVADGHLEKGRYWVGFNDAEPAHPTQLQRAYAYRGHWVKLADNNLWLIPTPNELPHDLIPLDDGGWKFEVQRKYHDHILQVDMWRQLFLQAGKDDEFDFESVAEFVLRALRLNYRITREVVGQLRLFTRQNVTPAMFAAAGMLETVGRDVEG